MDLDYAWTYSTLELFESCPSKFFHLRVARDFKDKPYEHRQWGQEVDQALEQRVLNGTPLPDGMQQWEGIMSKIAGLPGEKYPQIKLAVSESFGKAPWAASWSRGQLDLLVVNGNTATALDYKTGKRKPSEQLQLYAGYTFSNYPKVEVVQTAFVWLKDRKLDRANFQREQVSDIWGEFVPRVARLQAAYKHEKWPERPSGLCRGWCPVTSCKFWEPGK